MTEDVLRNRAIRLFTYLKELTELRTKVIRTLDQYDDVIWFSDIPKKRGCFCSAWRQSSDYEPDLWLRIEKPKFKAPPEPPKNLQSWLESSQIADSSIEMPELKDSIVVEKPSINSGIEQKIQTEIIKLADYPEIKVSWEKYVEEKWWPWAEEDRKIRKVQAVYTKLYSVYQKQQRLGEAYEVVIGLGLLLWKHPDGYEIKRHIITARTNIEFLPLPMLFHLKGNISIL